VARAYHRALAVIFGLAFASLGQQVQVLIGSRGLLPIAPLIARLRETGEIGFLDFPTLFWLGASDGLLGAGIWLGLALSVLALAGLWPRVCFALLVPLYLAYATAGRDLLSFQWDNLLVESGMLAIFLPRDRPLPWIHLLFRLLLFKLYFESGIAKWQSHLGDWQDGSAMTFYYETAPIPTLLAWYAHQLPEWWHHFESRAALVLELAVPFAIFSGRRARLAALVALSGFQVVNLLTANYGFFVLLALALHLFLVDDSDLRSLRARIPGLGGIPDLGRAPGTRARLAVAVAVSTLFVGLSLAEALRSFAPPGALRDAAGAIGAVYGRLRLVNAYHLFGHVTRERIEPEFQTRDGEEWTPHHFWYKVGPLDRAPPFVAPHQPRVDFRLWFYGLGFRRGVPEYVGVLLHRMCTDPEAVQPLFASELPAEPEAVRIVFGRYRFTDPEQRRESGAWWSRTWLARIPEVSCEEARGHSGAGRILPGSTRRFSWLRPGSSRLGPTTSRRASRIAWRSSP
jgi:hypothetical protein